jgi:hypothetical protein
MAAKAIPAARAGAANMFEGESPRRRDDISTGSPASENEASGPMRIVQSQSSPT